MSLDHPFYEELCRRRHPARRWWVVGDVLYYLGLIGGIICWVLGLWFSRVAWGSVVGLLTFFIGVWCKGRSYSMAMRDGIDVDAY